MSSMQSSAGSGKSAKFTAANPLDPMLNPFPGMTDDQKDAHAELTENVNSRVQKAMGDLVEKHRTGTNEIDDPDRAPSGLPYQEARRQQAAVQEGQRRRQQQTIDKNRLKEDQIEKVQRQVAEKLQGASEGDDDDDDDSDYDDLLDDDPILDAIRQKRIAELKQKQADHLENMSKGHGELRTISQDEFLPECTGSSKYVAVHFFHGEFERCKIMDYHLKIIASQHTTCKFLRIDAEKAPFFVSKLQVRTLPTVVVFDEGKAVNRLTGFEGLSKDPNDPDVWKTRALKEFLAATGAIEYMPSEEELREDMEELGLKKRPTGLYRGGMSTLDDGF